MKTIPLTPQERSIVEETYVPFIQALTIIAKLRGLDPRTAILSSDRTAFVIREESDAVELTNGISQLG